MEREVIEYSPARADFRVGPLRATLDGETNTLAVVEEATGNILFVEREVNVRRLGEILGQIEKSLKNCEKWQTK